MNNAVLRAKQAAVGAVDGASDAGTSKACAPKSMSPAVNNAKLRATQAAVEAGEGISDAGTSKVCTLTSMSPMQGGTIQNYERSNSVTVTCFQNARFGQNANKRACLKNITANRQ